MEQDEAAAIVDIVADARGKCPDEMPLDKMPPDKMPPTVEYFFSSKGVSVCCCIHLM